MDDTPAFETLAVSHGESPRETRHGDVVSPIHLASTYAVQELDTDLSLEGVDPDDGQFLYSRLNNPTRHALERRLAALEGGDHGFAFGSGTAAIATAAFAAVEPGDHVVAFDDLYAGTRRMLETLFEGNLGVAVSFVDATDPDAVADAIRPETAFVWMETPTNPRIKLCDIAAIADITDDAGVLFGVDNTFLSPYFQQPLALGADVVAHSTTKYLNGHSDAVGGALVTNNDALADSVEFLQQVGLGNMLAPFDAYLVLRGIKTLAPRMRDHEANALAIAEYLADHDRVTAVHYPGLDSHPQHDLADAQQSGYGGILSFELDGDLADAKRFLDALDEFNLAVSVGGVESLVELPAGMTHEPIPKPDREAMGITDSLIRVSVGIEAIEDLIADLDRGFEAVRSTTPTA
ncbi:MULTISPECIES: trans-sulfuration enzyme family protein [Halobacterium]|uniref:Cystathionine gamma-synthase n=4 Tax=Halobacterium salinarum TaxID=2242 RepID=Q9HR98_HALSA|nr:MULTISPECIES: PLP-dependent aspartate aminotransferase family protein [Halobacterium]AAG19260.1 cystathionine gamma-synthase [Halobacterium salinarum NRC-1]MBB6090373.1 cystathionine gamma-lyase [Halobacterium salinarum]MCF2166314.1 PLP-dependent aspartate aminotransferase family protein [Halobacterium salinarum]MCF2168817.1 PLP-dependent aspartate aminotransferase family protein [Halobacterium salinarum]MCF2207099.1 PLP-dependent aspartate aminotransferase family protein [Halobacterium sal